MAWTRSCIGQWRTWKSDPLSGSVTGCPITLCWDYLWGRFVAKKGFDRVVQAAAPDYTLVFAGGDEAEVPQDLVSSGPGGEMLFLGRLNRESLSEVYRACDFFVLPSVAEGFPLSIMEAMASGLPIVTSDEPGYDYYNLDRSRVSLVGGDSDLLRAELQAIAGDADRRTEMGQYSSDYASATFRWETHCNQLQLLYQGAVTSKAVN